MADLNGKRIAFLATDMVEQVGLTDPWKAVTSRNPDDLPAFCRTLVEEFAKTPVRA